MLSFHVGEYCRAVTANENENAQNLLVQVQNMARLADEYGLEVHAGHGLCYQTVGAVAAIEQMVELNIGHFLIGEAIFCGLEAAIVEMPAAHASSQRDKRDGRIILIIGIGNEF